MPDGFPLSDIRWQLTLFARCIYEPDDVIEIRRLPSKRSTWHTASELADLGDALLQDAVEDNLYVGINPRKAAGGTRTDDVALCRCLAADFDGVDVRDARDRWTACNLPDPTLIVASGHGAHIYLRLNDPLDCETWSSLQRLLAEMLGTDRIHDPPRILRLPGTRNHKPPPADVVVFDGDPARRCSLHDLADRFPDNPDSAPTVKPPLPQPATLDFLSRAVRYAEKWPAVAQGGRNTAATYHSAQLTKDFGLDDAAAWSILAGWNQRNAPPLDDDELRACLTNGRKYGRHAVGSIPPPRYTSAGVPGGNGQPKALPPLPQAPAPWITPATVMTWPAYAAGLPVCPTGIAALDNMLGGGLRSGGVTIVASRTKGGKSIFAANLVAAAAGRGEAVLFATLEDSAVIAAWRMQASIAAVSMDAMLDGLDEIGGEYSDNLSSTREYFANLPVRFSELRPIDDLTTVIERHVADDGRLVVVDQLSKVTTPNLHDRASQYERVSYVSEQLRYAASKHRVPIIVVVQVNRESNKRMYTPGRRVAVNEKITYSDLRDSGMLEQDAFAVILLQRPRMDRSGNRLLPVELALQRFGPSGQTVDLRWWPEYSRIEDA